MQGRGPCSALVSSGKNGYCTGSLQPNFSHTYMCARNVFPLISGGKVALNRGSGLWRFNATNVMSRSYSPNPRSREEATKQAPVVKFMVIALDSEANDGAFSYTSPIRHLPHAQIVHPGGLPDRPSSSSLPP